MQWVRFAIVVLAAAFIQGSSIPQWIAITRFDISPDLLLILLVYFAVFCEGPAAIIASFSLGLAADLTYHTLGPYLLSFGLCGSLLHILRTVVTVRRTLHTIAAVFLTGLSMAIMAKIIIYFRGGSEIYTLVKIFGMSVYSALLSPYVFAGLGMLSGWLGIKRHRS
jgi:rod shape-determining protein MreD